jgi:hypothetical protein
MHGAVATIVPLHVVTGGGGRTRHPAPMRAATEMSTATTGRPATALAPAIRTQVPGLVLGLVAQLIILLRPTAAMAAVTVVITVGIRGLMVEAPLTAGTIVGGKFSSDSLRYGRRLALPLL